MSRARPPSAVRLHLAFGAAAAFLGSMAVAGKAALREMPPGLLAFIRSSGASLLLVLIATAGGRSLRLPRGRTLGRLLLAGLFGVVINQLCFLHGLRRTTALATGILICAIPVFTAIFASLAGADRLGARRAIGIAVSLAGVLVFLGADPAALAAAGATPLGNALIVANSAGYALYLIVIRPLLRTYAPAVLLGWLYGLGALVILPFALADLRHTDLHAISPTAWASVGWVIVGGTVIPYLLVQWALARSGPVLASLYTFVQPLATAAFAIPLLGERLTWIDAAGAGLIVAGVRLASSGPRPQR